MENILDLNSEIDKIFFKNINKIATNTEFPKFVYHYTSQAAYLNILSSNEIWLSNISNLNDPQELVFGISVIKNYLNNTINNKESLLLNWLKDLDPFRNNEIMNLYTNPFFLMSFSEQTDMLNQWIAYGDDGHGVALSFLSAKLIPLLTKTINPTTGPIFMPISYYTQNYKFSSVGISNYLDHILEIFIEIDKIAENSKKKYDILHGLQRIFLSYLYLFASYIKHDFYKEEKEWRLLVRTGFGDRNIKIIEKNKSVKAIYKIYLQDREERNNSKTKNKTILKEIHKHTIIGPRHMRDQKILSALEIAVFQELGIEPRGTISFSNGLLKTNY